MMTKNEENKQSGKIIYLEVLRIISAVLVIFNHTEKRGYWLFADYSSDSVAYWLCLFVSVACKVAVPVFFAISGALLLDKRESIKRWSKRVLRMAAILVVFSLIYYLNLIIPVNYGFDIKNFLTMLYCDKVFGLMWFLYAYIGMLLIVPFLRLMVKDMDKTLFFLLVAFALLFVEIIPSLEYLVFKGAYHIAGYLIPKVVTEIIFFPCIGYYVVRKMDSEELKKLLTPAWILTAFEIFLASFMTTFLAKQTRVLTEKDSQLFIDMCIMNCLAILITAKYLGTTHSLSDTVRKIITEIASCTFGIYLLHMLFLERSWMVYIPDKLVSVGFNRLAAGFLWSIMTFVFCGVCAFIIRRIPLLKKLVGG